MRLLGLQESLVNNLIGKLHLLYLFLTALKNLQMGYASAIAWIVPVFVAVVTIWLYRTSGRWVHYRGAVT